MRGVPTNAELKVARALRSSTPAHTRTVAGVARSLGAPIVSARPSATEGSVVTIVVGWELTWYRFEVDLGNEAAGVRVAAQGTELPSSIGRPTPNAAADDAGQLHPWRPSPRSRSQGSPMIYCVVPEELADELYDRLADYYADDPNVEGHHRPAQVRAALGVA